MIYKVIRTIATDYVAYVEAQSDSELSKKIFDGDIDFSTQDSEQYLENERVMVPCLSEEELQKLSLDDIEYLENEVDWVEID